MQEFIAVFVSFFAIPLLTRRKVAIGVAICICAILLTLLSGLGINVLFEVIFSTLTDPGRVQQYIVILEIGILGVLL